MYVYINLNLDDLEQNIYNARENVDKVENEISKLNQEKKFRIFDKKTYLLIILIIVVLIIIILFLTKII